MRLAAIPMVILAVAGTAATAFGQYRVDDLGMIADHLGSVHAWRMIPPTLFERCISENPAQESSLRASYERWSRDNHDLIPLIDRTVDLVVPLFAKANSMTEPETKRKIIEETSRQINEVYLSNVTVNIARVCADYPVIVAKLSDAGHTAVIRGKVYALEGMVAARREKVAPERTEHRDRSL